MGGGVEEPHRAGMPPSRPAYLVRQVSQLPATATQPTPSATHASVIHPPLSTADAHETYLQRVEVPAGPGRRRPGRGAGGSSPTPTAARTVGASKVIADLHLKCASDMTLGSVGPWVTTNRRLSRTLLEAFEKQQLNVS